MSFSSATVSTGDVTKKSDYDRLLNNTLALKTTIVKYNITGATDETVNLPDSTDEISNRLYYRTGAGAGKVLFSAYGAQTINEIADTNWFLEDEEAILLAPIATGWRVLLYGGYDESGNLIIKPASGGRIIFDDDNTNDSVGTLHFRSSTPSTTKTLEQSVTARTWYTATFNDLPAGTKAVECSVLAYGHTQNLIFWRPYGSSWDFENTNSIIDIYSTNVDRMGVKTTLPVDSSGRVQLATNQDCTLVVYDYVAYYK